MMVWLWLGFGVVGHAAEVREADQEADLTWRLGAGYAHDVAARAAPMLQKGTASPRTIRLYAQALAALGEGPMVVASVSPLSDATAALLWTVAAVEGLPNVDAHCGTVEAVFSTTWPDAVLWELDTMRPRIEDACPYVVLPPPLVAAPAGREVESLARALQSGSVDLAWGQAVAQWVMEGPRDLTLAGNPWSADARGAGLVHAQVALAAGAVQAVNSDDPIRVLAGIEVIRWQGLDDTTAWRHLRDLWPGALPTGWMVDAQTRWQVREYPHNVDLDRRISVARSNAAPDRRLHALLLLDAEVPASGWTRSSWAMAVSEAHRDLGHPRRQLEAMKRAWEATPSSGYLAASYAEEAARQQRNMDDALSAMTVVLAQATGYRADRGGPSGDTSFRWVQAQTESQWWATRGWLRYRMGDLPGARADIDHALILARRATAKTHLWAGLVAEADGDVEAALFHLREGLVHVDVRVDPPDLVALGHLHASTLFSAYRWHPNGLTGWLAGRSAELGTRASSEGPIVDLDAVSDALAERGPSLPLEGQRLPDMVVDVDGAALPIDEIEGWKVVDLWAIWCVPCHAQTDALHRLLADAHEAGVPLSLVVVSVETDKRTEWPASLDQQIPGVILAWRGPEAVERWMAPGLPSAYLVDPEGTVVAAHSGWTGDVEWVRAALVRAGVWTQP